MKESKKESIGKIETDEEGKMEKEKQSYPIALVYRENDLYKEMIPQVTKALESLGHEVKIQNFPAGTDYEKMKEQVDKIITSEDLTSGMKIITDETTGGPVRDSETLYKQFKNLEGEDFLKARKDILKGGYLDRLFDKATATMLWGEDYVKSKREYTARLEGEENLELGEKSFKAVIKRILEDERNHPHKIYIIPNQLDVHLPFRDKIGKYEAAELLQKWAKDSLGETKIDAECLIAGDISRRFNSYTEELNQEGNWIIADRHPAPYWEWSKDYKGKPRNDPNKKVKLLQLPVPSMLRGAIDEGLISFSEKEKEKFAHILTTILKEDFGEEQKEE